MIRSAAFLAFLASAGPVLAQNAPVSYGQPTPGPSTEASRTLKLAGGSLFGFQVNTGATAGWVMLFASATVPGDGAVTPVKWWQVAANSTIGVSYNPPLLVPNGITLVFSSTGPFTKTASATALFSGEAQ